MNLTVYNADGKQVGEYEIDPSELSPKINKQLLHDAVVMYQANLRQGTFRTKSRGEVSGTTKKKCIGRRVPEMPVLVRKEVVFVVVVGIYLQNAREILVGECREKRFSQQPEWR
jgi:hypothetical protein